MLKLKILLFVLLINFSQAFAQKEPIKFGDVDEADVKATKYDKFPDAEAVVLCDYGSVYYTITDAEMFLIFKRIKRIKILKKSGFEQGNQSIYCHVASNNDREKVTNLKAYTYTYENDKVVKTKLDKGTGVSEHFIDKDTYEVKFAMPNIKEGAVIEFSYELNSDFFWHIPIWYFQNTIPVLWSEYRINIPAYFEFVQVSQGYQKFHVQEKKRRSNPYTGFPFTRKLYITPGLVGDGTYNEPQHNSAGSIPKAINTYESDIFRWVAVDIPPFKDEPFIGSVNDHIFKMEFQLAATNFPQDDRRAYMEGWERVVKTLREHEKHGQYLDKGLPEKTILNKIIANSTTPKEKVVVIYDYVKTNIEYNGEDDVFTHKTLRQVWQDKSGNVAEVNLLLVNMLREAGIEADPVILSTRYHGKILQQYPLVSKLNYVVVYVNIDDKEDMLLDATDKMLQLGMLSYQALNGVGLLTQKDGKFDWVNLQSSKNAKITHMITSTLDIDKTGTMKGGIVERFGGYEAINMRRKLAKVHNDELTKFTWKNAQTLDKPLDGTKKIETSEFCQVNDDFIYFTPLLDYRMKENPFKNAERNFDVDYACIVEKSFYMNFVIPEGYVVEDIPKPMRLKWQDESVKFDYTVTATGNKIQLVSKFVLSRPVFKADEYKALRDLYAQIVAKQEEQIVLKKK